MKQITISEKTHEVLSHLRKINDSLYKKSGIPSKYLNQKETVENDSNGS